MNLRTLLPMKAPQPRKRCIEENVDHKKKNHNASRREGSESPIMEHHQQQLQHRVVDSMDVEEKDSTPPHGNDDTSSRPMMATIKRMTSSSFHSLSYTKSMDTDSPASYPKHVIIPSPSDSHENHHHRQLPLGPRPSGSFMDESPIRNTDHDKVVTPISSNESRRQQQQQQQYQGGNTNYGNHYNHHYSGPTYRPQDVRYPAVVPPPPPPPRYDGYGGGHSNYYSPHPSDWEAGPYYGDTHSHHAYNNKFVSPSGATGNSAKIPPPTTPSPSSKRSWSCDYCHVATFPTYEDACIHEEACAARYGVLHRQQPPPLSPHTNYHHHGPSSSYLPPPHRPHNHHHGLGTLYQAAAAGVGGHQELPNSNHHHPYNSNNNRMPPPPSTPYQDAFHYHHPPPPPNHYSPQLPPYRYSQPSGWGNAPPMPSERSNYPTYPTLSPQFKDASRGTTTSTGHPYEDVYYGNGPSYGNNNIHNNPQGMLLSMPDDADSLSDRQCYVRAKFVEVFAATENDVAARHSKGAQKLTMGQVGIRCLHCAHLRPKDRAERAICYPSSISRIYQTVADMQRFHFEQCREIPDDVRRIYKSLKTTRPRGVGSPQVYWIQSAKLLHLVDSEEGIFFGTNPPNDNSEE
jgi:hypothetical protein